jgi:hypothetical protein
MALESWVQFPSLAFSSGPCLPFTSDCVNWLHARALLVCLQAGVATAFVVLVWLEAVHLSLCRRAGLSICRQGRTLVQAECDVKG